MLRITRATPGRRISPSKTEGKRGENKRKHGVKGSANSSKRRKKSPQEHSPRERAIAIALQKATEALRIESLPKKKKKPLEGGVAEHTAQSEAAAARSGSSTNGAKRPSHTRAELKAIAKKKRKKAENRNRRTLKGFWRQLANVPTPPDLRWQQRQQEIAKLIEDIQWASFATLAAEWKKHVGLTGYIEETGRNQERLPTYTSLIAAIELEWGRRAKLTFNADQYFDWPSTRAGRSRKGIADINWASEGFLSYLGYHVGESSDLTDLSRRAILRRTFKMVLPPLESPDYVRSWGAPSSPTRLKKMADSLASFARSAKRRSSSNFATAIAEWEADLAMLYDEFYVAKFGFGWPQV